MKKIDWNPHAREFIKSLDTFTKKEIGTLLIMLQQGVILKHPQVKPMKMIHSSAYEMRIRDAKGIYRLIYVLVSENKILIPHAFTKKTQKTPKKEIELTIKRLQELFKNEKSKII